MIKAARFPSILLMSVLLITLTGCKGKPDSGDPEPSAASSSDHRITEQDIEAMQWTEFALSDEAEAATQDWLKFQELQSQIDLLKKGDLSFFKDDKTMLVSLITDLRNEIPEAVNTEAINVRISVLETVMFKLEGLANLKRARRDVLLRAINGVFIAHSNLILQINKKFEKESQNVRRPE